ncbi:SpoIID/LytB domain-containing protein [Chitinispirillales bacterium ANBcel5]|uniref:SpoIID/LytB domain-containing protein n=1 Tax=Cellulosispirillum alkaliphilum TaxID=3039283 RepID=UPI002A504657|nr:SpoIID/LytB domain-containing protein [Chitinispirillales bacterium ANBcel5]
MLSCSSPLLVPDPDRAGHKEEAEPLKDEDTAERRVEIRDVDFARAFDEHYDSSCVEKTDTAVSDSKIQALKDKQVHSFRYPPLRLNKRPVRILLRSDVSRSVVYSPSRTAIVSSSEPLYFRGRLELKASNDTETIAATVNNQTKVLSLPCTLKIKSEVQAIDVEEDSYRGALILVSKKKGTFSIVNLVDVEDYLRGVVPKEMGSLPESDIEALKSQAVAARTYSYQRMAANENNFFDMHRTVADQVYGGANVEFRTTDLAVRMTKDLVLSYNNTLVHAYYHSTCGGRTANVEDIWGHNPYPYLKSVVDTDSRGKSWCSISRYYTWEESWSTRQLSNTLSQFSSEGRLAHPYSGSVRDIRVNERFSCGRIKECSIRSTVGEYSVGGDRIRFLMRRNTQSRGILRSSRFEIKSLDRNRVQIAGSGFGHGIGMCQMGAIGRSRAGQSFEQILKAYYTGVQIRTAVSFSPHSVAEGH